MDPVALVRGLDFSTSTPTVAQGPPLSAALTLSLHTLDAHMQVAWQAHMGLCLIYKHSTVNTYGKCHPALIEKTVSQATHPARCSRRNCRWDSLSPKTMDGNTGFFICMGNRPIRCRVKS